MTEPYRLTRWVDGLESSTPVNGDSLKRGAKSRNVVVAGGKRYPFTTEVIELKRDTLFITHSTSEGNAFSISAMYELAPSGPGTRLHYVGTADYASVFARLMEPVVSRKAQGKIEADLKHLKELIEAQPGKPGI